MAEQNGSKPEDGNKTGSKPEDGNKAGGRPPRNRRPAPKPAADPAPKAVPAPAEEPEAASAPEGGKRPPNGRRRPRNNGGNHNGGANPNHKQPAANPADVPSPAQTDAPKKRGRPKKAALPAAEVKNEANSSSGGQKNHARSGGGRGRKPPAEPKVSPGSEIKTAAQVAAAHLPSVVKITDLITPVVTARRRGRKSSANKPKVRIIPLGGLGEVGKNLTVFECGNDAFILDCGLTFPDESMPGIDLVIPDFTYIIENADKMRGIALTHGHEDHIGGVAYLLKHVNLPLYGTRLTLGLVEGKLKEHGLLNKAVLNVQKPGDIVSFGCMKVELIGVNHSVPDACAMAIHTPVGIIVHTGDFKIDFTPIRGPVINLARFGELGSQGVLALLSDSTNAERPGSTASERTVGESFDKIFGQTQKKRIIVASFSSNVHRLQQIIDAAVNYKRKVAVFGRSMENVVSKALEIGYLDIPSGVLVDVAAIDQYPDEKMVIITTGSQGEPMSALTRMAMGDHRKVSVGPNDCIIISASPIPGNEKLVSRVINELMKLGAQVVYEKMYEIHVSGHACQDEQKMMLSLTRPKFFVPMHGEFKHLKKHADTAISMGMDPKDVLIGDVGLVIETDGDTMGFSGTVTSGKVLVDGLGVGDVGSVVLRDRKHLAQDGLIVIVTAIEPVSGKILSGPDIISRGFVYVRESESMISRTRAIARDTINRCVENGTREWGVIKQKIKDDVGSYLWQRTKRNPMILPVIQEVRE